MRLTPDPIGSGHLSASWQPQSGPSTPSPVAAQFTSEGATLSGLDLELLGGGYRMSLVKRRFATGSYCGGWVGGTVLKEQGEVGSQERPGLTRDPHAVLSPQGCTSPAAEVPQCLGPPALLPLPAPPAPPGWTPWTGAPISAWLGQLLSPPSTSRHWPLVFFK